MTRFLPPQIFSIPVFTYGCRVVRLDSRASPFGVQMDIPGVEEDRTGYEKVARGWKWRFGAGLRLTIRFRLRVLQDSTMPTGAPPARSKRQRADRAPLSADLVLEDYVAPGFRYPPRGDIRPRYPVTTSVEDTPLLTGLIDHPSSLVCHCEDPRESIGRGGWSDFCQLLDAARQEYREFLAELGFGPFLSIRYVHVWHPLVRCWVERFFYHTGTFHLSTYEMGVFPVDWSAILGIRFGGRIPPSEPISGPEALDILGIDDLDAIDGTRLPSLKVKYLRDLLRREMGEPPTELRYRQWVAYFIFTCFLGNEKSTVPTPIIGMFRDVDALRDYDWGALTYGFYIWGLRRFSRRETISFLGFWQFTIFWAFEHFPMFAPSRLPSAPDSLGGEAVVPVDPPQLMTIEGYIPRAPSDSYVEGVDTYPGLVQVDVPYQEWFERVSLGSLMSLHEVEGGRVMGGTAMDNHLFRSSGEIDRLQSEILRLQLELSMRAELAQRQRDVDSRDAELAIWATSIRRLEDQLLSTGIAPLTGASSSGHGQTSSPPPLEPVSRDWFFDDPPSL
uniref:Aminotransferase-like plant mobile domain-containing protein n=1 Tax=Fagus sylvatica TaxID=28930 RepID=A0A2N9I3D5_FAGSY